MIDVEVSQEFDIVGQDSLTFFFSSHVIVDIPKLDSFIVATSHQIMFVKFYDFH